MLSPKRAAIGTVLAAFAVVAVANFSAHAQSTNARGQGIGLYCVRIRNAGGYNDPSTSREERRALRIAFRNCIRDGKMGRLSMSSMSSGMSKMSKSAKSKSKSKGSKQSRVTLSSSSYSSSSLSAVSLSSMSSVSSMSSSSVSVSSSSSSSSL